MQGSLLNVHACQCLLDRHVYAFDSADNLHLLTGTHYVRTCPLQTKTFLRRCCFRMASANAEIHVCEEKLKTTNEALKALRARAKRIYGLTDNP